jgi:hypothetical protein
MSRCVSPRIVTRMKTRRLLLAFAAALAALAANPSPAPAHDHAALRSGHTVGLLTNGYSNDVPCWQFADCSAWSAAGCPGAAAGRKVALYTSVVRTGGLADGTTERHLNARYPVVESWIFGVARVDFWTRDCRPIESAAFLSGALRDGTNVNPTEFVIPTDARWMTVASGSPMTWTLY